jgi:phosphoribosylaminoimidazolecarboxamide formyltransferase/IMP cyclohydrolase
VYRASHDSGVANGTVLQGKAVSYNNYLDLDAAQRCAHAFDAPACAIIKHTNPCGLAQAQTLPEAFARALAGDPVSAFGGILGFNREVDAHTAEAIRASKLFVECIVAPGFSHEARALFAPRENLRLMQATMPTGSRDFHAHRIGGGWLVQSRDPGPQSTEHWRVVTETQLQSGFADELLFAMHAAWLLKSNAIAITHHGQLIGTGMGQTNRVDAAKQALERAGDQARGAFLASDAFFPFADCVALVRDAGIAAIVQPGGSKRDQESIDLCNVAGIPMVFTGKRHFRH